MFQFVIIGGSILASVVGGAFYLYQRQKTNRSKETTKQTQEVTKQLQITANQTPEQKVGNTSSSLDDWALTIQKSLPYALFGVALFIGYKIYKSG